MTEKPTFVLVHGALHSGEAFTTLKEVLETKSYPVVIAANSPSLNSENGFTTTLATDVTFIRNEVLTPLIESGKHLIVVMHSYAGVSAAAATEGLSVPERQGKGLTGGIVGGIYMTSVCVPVGSSVAATFQELGVDLSPWTTMDMEKGVVVAKSPEAAIPQFYHHLPADEALKWAQKLGTLAIGCLTTNVEYAPWAEPAWQGRCAYLFCEDDQMLPLKVQQAFVQKGKNFVITRSLPTTHSPFLDQPEETAAALIELADLFPKI